MNDNVDAHEEAMGESEETQGAASGNGPDVLSEIASMKEALNATATNINSLVNKLQPQQQTRSEIPDLTPEQKAEIEKNPMRFVTETLARETAKATQRIEQESTRNSYDRRAYESFPSLNTNEKFKKDVVAKMDELIKIDGYTRESPTLLLRAAEYVAGKHGVSQPQAPSRNQMTSLEPSGARPTNRTKIEDSDPRVEFLKLFGVTDPKKIEKFKSGLDPYVAPTRKPGKELIR